MSEKAAMRTGVPDIGWAATALRIGFGAIWAIDAALKWQPGFRESMLPTMVAAAKGQPNWLMPWFNFWIHLMQRPTPELWVYLIAIIETVIAVMLITGTGRRVVYIGGALYSLLIWTTAEGIGGPYTPDSTDLGPSIIYVLVSWALLIELHHGHDRHLALDNAIARRVPWWSRIAGPSEPERR